MGSERPIVEEHVDIDSTQRRMRERIQLGEDVHGRVVRAELQHVGSGTRGRTWSSELGGSYQTVAVREDRLPSGPQGGDGQGPDSARPLAAPGVSVAVGIGLAAALTEHGARAMVKWPNDLYYRGKKLGGILCEAYQGFLLVGVGVNVENTPPAGGVALTGWQLSATHDLVLAGVLDGLALWTAGRPLGEPFTAFDWLAGREVSIRTGGRSVSGTAHGVTADGALRVGGHTVPDGTVLRVGATP